MRQVEAANSIRVRCERMQELAIVDGINSTPDPDSAVGRPRNDSSITRHNDRIHLADMPFDDVHTGAADGCVGGSGGEGVLG